MKRILRNFELNEKIASGGMGTVYKATQLSLRRSVAVKELHPALSNQKEYTERFEREALVLASMFNENIVGIIDFGRENNSYYIVMEYVDGVSLATILDNLSGINHNTSLTIIESIARGLAFAHNKGVIHRDLKPANILVSRDGVLKITDFGLCRPLKESNITRTTTLMGTPRYMSPEQARGKPVDQRSDIYTLGILFFELLTGFYAIWSDNTAEILHEVAYGPKLDIERLPRKLNKEIVNLIRHSTEKKKENRFDDCYQILSNIRRIRSKYEEFRDPAHLEHLLYKMGMSPQKNTIFDVLRTKDDETLVINDETTIAEIDDNLISLLDSADDNQYFRFIGKVDELIPSKYIVRFNDFFLKTSEYEKAEKLVNEKKKVLLIGRPASGKTRMAFQVILENYEKYKEWNLIIPKVAEIDNVNNILEMIPEDKNIILWDDIDQYISFLDANMLLNEIQKKSNNLIVIGTLRSGDEFRTLETQRTEWLYIFDDRIMLEDLSDENAVSLAKNIDFGNLSNFDGTPGSIVLDLSKVKARYNKYDNPHRGILKTMKMLFLLGIRNVRRDLILDLCNKFFGCNCTKSKLRETLHNLIDNAFVKRENHDYTFYHATYANRIITDYEKADIVEDLPEIINSLIDFADPYYIVNLAHYLSLEENHMMTIELANKAIEIKPDFAKAYSLLGLAQCNIESYDSAIENFSKAIEIKPESADFYNNRGVAKSYLGFYEEAIKDYTEALKLKSDHAETFFNRGTVYYNIGEYKNALDDYNHVIGIIPDYAPAYNNRGIVKAYELGNIEDAMSDYEKAITIDPQYTYAYYNLANLKCYYENDFDSAIENYDIAIEQKSDFAEAYYNRGIAFIFTHNIDEAIRSFATAVELADWVRSTLANDDDLITFLDKNTNLKDEYVKRINSLIYPEKIGESHHLAFFPQKKAA